MHGVELLLSHSAVVLSMRDVCLMLAKEFSPNASYKYVNAVLDKVSSGE